MTPNTTPRGFAMYAEVQIGGDGYDPITTFTVQESSLARERRVWVGKNGLNRAHLDESQARTVRDGLSAFLGDDIPSRDGEELASAIERGDPLTEVEQLRVVVANLRGRIARLLSRPDDVFESADAAYTWLADEARRGGPEWEYGYELVDADTGDVLTRGFPFINAAEAVARGKERAAEEPELGAMRIVARAARRRCADPWEPLPED